MSTGLNSLKHIIRHDSGLLENVSVEDKLDALQSASQMNNLITKAIKVTDCAHDGNISVDDVRSINTWIRAADARNNKWDWATLHGDDEGGQETGFHLVQNDGATTTLFGENAVDTVADGIYHLGFEIQGNNVLNEDGNANATLGQLSQWLNGLLAVELALTADAVNAGNTDLFLA